ncbi:MAG: FAD-dependent monooxygenase [Rhizobiaceae bacterium]|nr:FAD-dependent monooxygenase [Rhizobiaceae bacterium]
MAFESNVNTHVPVLIVGAGPVGLALSIDLALRGIHNMIVERRTPRIVVPKMNMVNARSMEFSRRWGIAEDVRAQGSPDDLPLDVLFCTSLCGYEIARFPYPSYRERGELPYTPEGSWRISQMYYDPLLIERARTLSEVTLCHQTECLSFEDDGDHVRVRLRDLSDGTERQVTASYLVACDGAESGIREALGIEMQGPGQLSRNINLFFTTPDLVALHDKGYAWANWLMGANGQWGMIVSVDGRTMWRMSIPLPPGRDSMEETEACALIEKAVGCTFDYELRAILPWIRRQLVAEQYSRGRVFVAGDAAHVMSPTGGLGMNTGLGDAVDLSWKMAAALQGWGGPQLLASYDLERRPIAVTNTAEAGENFKKIRALPGAPQMLEDSPEGTVFRAQARTFIETGGYREEYEQEATVLGYRYSGSPLLPREDETTIAEHKGAFRQGDHIGGRAPHVWLADGRSSIDVYWSAMTLVTIGAADITAAQLAARALAIPLQVLELTPQQAEGLFTQPITLVRPDGHVAWKGKGGDWHAILSRATGTPVN